MLAEKGDVVQVALGTFSPGEGFQFFLENLGPDAAGGAFPA